jgi:hypothetical protein
MTDISTIVVSALAAVGATDGAQLTMPPHPEFDAMGRAIDELRNEMRRAIDVGEPKRKIVQIFLRASDISAEAAGAEALHKKKKDLKRPAAFRVIGLRVDLLRAQSLTDLEKAGRRFMGRPGEGTKIGTPPPPHLITLGDLFPRHSQDQARKLSQDLQLLSKLSLTNFEALVADPTAPRPRSGPEKRLLPLSSIRADEQAQPRAALDTDRVAEYFEAMGRGEKFPPPVLFQDKKGRYWLADGFHRFQAAVELKRKTIECTVYQGELRDAILFSCGANASHGLPRTNADKRQAVTKLLSDEEWSHWTDSEIARRCKVSDHLVAQLRKELEPVTSNSRSEPRTYRTKHGTTARMRTENIGRQRAPAPESEKGSSEQGPQPQSALSPQESPEPAPEAAPEPVKEPAPADDDAMAQELAPAADAAPTPAGEPAPPPDPWAGQSGAFWTSFHGLANIQDVDFGAVAAAMSIDELLEARDDCERAALIIEKWWYALDKAIESAAGARDK